MNTYTIIHDNETIATVCGTEYAYEIYAKAKELADLTGYEVCLIWDDTAEVIAYYNPEEF